MSVSWNDWTGGDDDDPSMMMAMCHCHMLVPQVIPGTRKLLHACSKLFVCKRCEEGMGERETVSTRSTLGRSRILSKRLSVDF